jgi:DNA-binding FrmR family transcriptional regulator
MTNAVVDQEKLLRRVERIIGQVEAVKRSLEEGEECADVMLLIASARGAMNSLMAEVVEGHIREHMIDPDRKRSSSEARAAQELIDVVKSYLK